MSVFPPRLSFFLWSPVQFCSSSPGDLEEFHCPSTGTGRRGVSGGADLHLQGVGLGVCWVHLRTATSPLLCSASAPTFALVLPVCKRSRIDPLCHSETLPSAPPQLIILSSFRRSLLPSPVYPPTPTSLLSHTAAPPPDFLTARHPPR